MDLKLTRLASETILKTLDEDSLRHLISALPCLYKVYLKTCKWDLEQGPRPYKIIHKGIIAICTSVDQAQKELDNHMQDQAVFWQLLDPDNLVSIDGNILYWQYRDDSCTTIIKAHCYTIEPLTKMY